MSRADKGRRKSAPVEKPGRVDPILYAWRQVNPGRPIPPQLMTDHRASTIDEARQHRESDWSESWS